MLHQKSFQVTVKEGDDFKQVHSIQVPQDSLNDWQIVETEIDINSTTESFYITQTDYTGDFLIDRFYFVDMNTWLTCRTVQKQYPFARALFIYESFEI